MKRRDFLTLLGGAAVSWPLVVHAQQPAIPVVGFLNPTSPDALADRLRAFHRGLKDTGYVEGENVTILYRWAETERPSPGRRGVQVGSILNRLSSSTTTPTCSLI